MFCRLIIWRAKLDFDIIEILFKMDSGKQIKRDAICFRFLFPHPFMFCGFEFIRFFFFQKSNPSVDVGYIISVVSVNMQLKELAFILSYTERSQRLVKSNCYFKLSEHYIPSYIFVIICLINHSCHYCLPLMGGSC